MKPSEQSPLTALKIAELVKEAGVPDGTLNMIHGQHDTVNFICDHPDIRAVSFIGGNRAVRFFFNIHLLNNNVIQ